MVGDLCAVLLQADYLTLDGTTVIGVFLIMHYFIYFTCNPNHNLSLQYQASPIYIKILLKKNEVRGLYTVCTFFYTPFTHLVIIITSLSYILTL